MGTVRSDGQIERFGHVSDLDKGGHPLVDRDDAMPAAERYSSPSLQRGCKCQKRCWRLAADEDPPRLRTRLRPIAIALANSTARQSHRLFSSLEAWLWAKVATGRAGLRRRLLKDGATRRIHYRRNSDESVVAELRGHAIGVVDGGGTRRAGTCETVARHSQAVVAVCEPFLAVIDHLIVLRCGSLDDLIARNRDHAAIWHIDREAARSGVAAKRGIGRSVVELVAADYRGLSAAFDIVADQLAAKQAVAHGQTGAAVHVEAVLKIIDIGVAVVGEVGVRHADRFVSIVAGQNSFLIAGKGAVQDHQRRARAGILIPDSRAIPAQRIIYLRSGEGKPVHSQARHRQNDPLLVG